MAGIATKAASTWNVQIVVGNRGHVACRCRSTSAAEVRVPTRRRHLDRGDGIVARAPKPSSASSLSLISMASPREDRKSDRDGGGGFGRGWRVTSQRHRYPPVTGARIGCGDKCAAIDRDGRSLQGGGVGVGGGGGGRGGGGRRAGAGAGGLHVRWHFLAGGCRGRGRGDSCCSGALPRGTPVAITGHVASPRCLNHQPDEGSSPCNDKRFDSASRLVGDIQGRAEEVHSTVERQREVEGVSLQEKDRRPTAVPDTWCRSRLPRKLVVAVASALLVATPTPDLVLLWLTTGHVASFADMSAIAGPLDRPGQMRRLGSGLLVEEFVTSLRTSKLWEKIFISQNPVSVQDVDSTLREVFDSNPSDNIPQENWVSLVTGGFNQVQNLNPVDILTSVLTNLQTFQETLKDAATSVMDLSAIIQALQQGDVRTLTEKVLNLRLPSNDEFQGKLQEIKDNVKVLLETLAASEVSALFGYAERWAIAGPVLLILPAWRVASNILTDRKKKAAELLQEKRTEARIRATEAKREKERRERENRDQELKELKQGLLAAAKGWQLGKGSADVNRKRTQRTVDDLVKKLIQLNSVKSQLLYSQPDSKDRMPGPSNIEEMGNWSLIFISEGNRQGPDGLEVLDIPFVEVDPFIQIISAKDGSKTGNTRDPSSSPSQPQSDEQRQLVATNTANIRFGPFGAWQVSLQGDWEKGKTEKEGSRVEFHTFGVKTVEFLGQKMDGNLLQELLQVKIELPAMLQRQVEWRTLYLDEDLRIDRVGGDGIYLFQREGTMKELPSGGESTQETQATQKAQPTPTTSTAPQRSPTTPAPQTTPATRTDVIRK